MLQRQSWEITDELWEYIEIRPCERYNEIQGIDWEWLGIDGSMNKAPLAKESVGQIQQNEEKMREKSISS
ncbi:hypothetical protein ACJDU8_19870 [Clostridium sp. WILCCON 0269]|uniref:Transposase n=1 Tax=Candidatus Clostridium eludens TaxID=3381663 RepID=A0ABW8ST95_9CLOT